MNHPPPIFTSQEMLAKLVKFNTTSHLSNMDLIGFVRDYLNAYNIDSQLIYNDEGNKANLFATIGEEKDGGVVLSGHTDVVPVEGQDWHSDPFSLVEKDGKLYGRGSCDMKGFLACALAKLPVMTDAPLRRPLHLAFSFDEEVSCIGAPLMTAELGKSLPMPDIVIVGEPTMMRVVSAHKGIMSLRITARGYETHSSMTHIGVSAVMNLARIVNHIDEMGHEAKIRAKTSETAKRFTPPYTTLHVGIFNGGTAGNIISKHASALVDIRFLPDDDPDVILRDLQNWIDKNIVPEMQAKNPDTGIDIEVLSHTKGLVYDATSPAEQFVRAITGDNETHFASYATEAGLFQREGPGVVICGPGAIDQAHQPNEFLAKDQLRQCDDFLDKVISQCCI